MWTWYLISLLLPHLNLLKRTWLFLNLDCKRMCFWILQVEIHLDWMRLLLWTFQTNRHTCMHLKQRNGLKKVSKVLIPNWPFTHFYIEFSLLLTWQYELILVRPFHCKVFRTCIGSHTDCQFIWSNLILWASCSSFKGHYEMTFQQFVCFKRYRSSDHQILSVRSWQACQIKTLSLSFQLALEQFANLWTWPSQVSIHNQHLWLACLSKLLLLSNLLSFQQI